MDVNVFAFTHTPELRVTLSDYGSALPHLEFDLTVADAKALVVEINEALDSR